jgi:hypothetical protein
MRIIPLLGLLALSSCSTSPTTTYWTKSKGVTVVHHVSGSQDKIEKLTSIPSDTQKGGFEVLESKAVLAKEQAPSTPKKKEKDSRKDSGGSRLADEVHELKSQVKSLKEQVSAEPVPTPAEPAQQEAAAQPPPRMSQ